METNVLIVGAGPVGLTMAVELTRYGIPVRIVEKNQHRTEMSKALVVWSRTLELLDRAGCGRAFVDAGMKVTAANIMAGEKSIGRIELGHVNTPHPYALMLPQSETERLLEEQLNSLGVQVERGEELIEFTQSTEAVTVILRHANGTQEKVRASWLLGCDGAHSIVRHELTMLFTGSTQPSNWILGDVSLEGVRSPGEIEVQWHSDGMLAIFPITRERYRIIADIGQSLSEADHSDPTLSEVQELLDRRACGLIASDPKWLAKFHINERKVVDYRDRRVFLAGDAAHVHSPAGGQGMNTGMQDAFNLAWKLALVCRGLCQPEPLLNSYSSERSAVGKEVLKNASRITSLAILRGEVKQSVRNHIASLLFGFAAVRNAMADAFTELSIEYPHSPLNGKGTRVFEHPSPGERAPLIQDQPPVGAEDRPKFALFADSSGGKSQDAVRNLLQRHDDILELKLRPPYHTGGMWLVRPDGYVAVSTSRDSWNDVSAYLDRISGR